MAVKLGKMEFQNVKGFGKKVGKKLADIGEDMGDWLEEAFSF